jgi:replicative DNA helicase
MEELGLRQPPHSADAEQYVLGALLLDNNAFDSVSWLREDAFYAFGHRLLWRTVVGMLESGKPADVFTVCDALGDDLEKAGGATYIAGLPLNTPGTANIRRYAELVKDKAMRRDLASRAGAICEKAFGVTVPTQELVEEAENSILGVRDSRGQGGEVVHIGKAVAEYLDFIDSNPNGIETGLSDLDALTGGLRPGNLIIVAGRTHMGKTSFALQITESICAKAPGLVFSLEASRKEIAGRMVEWHKHRLGRDGAVDKVFKLNLFIDDTSSMTLGAMRARIRRTKKTHGVSLVVVDYLQLLRGKGDSREQEVAYISRELKAIAKDFEVPVIALSQLSRKVEERADKRPHMSDLRESGSIEQDADLIFMLYRPDYYDANFEGLLADAEIMVPKNRNNGRSGSVRVTFLRELGRFSDWLPDRYKGAA